MFTCSTQEAVGNWESGDRSLQHQRKRQVTLDTETQGEHGLVGMIMLVRGTDLDERLFAVKLRRL